MKRKEKRRALEVLCGMQERCNEQCPLFSHCPERNFNTLPDVEIDALYDHYISNPKCEIKVDKCVQDAKAAAEQASKKIGKFAEDFTLSFKADDGTWKELGKCVGIDVTEPGSQDAKADAGKLPMNLVPTQISRDIAQVRQYGNEKYGDPDNWRKVEKIRYVAALERHLLAYKDYLNGDDDGLDKESGIEHYKHMACNMAFICEMERWEKKE